MAGSKLGTKKYRPLQRDDSEEMMLTRSRKADGTPKFAIGGDDEIEELLGSKSPSTEFNLEITSKLGRSQTVLRDGDRVEMYTTGSVGDCSRCCLTSPLKSSASPLGIYKSTAGSSYLTRERCSRLSPRLPHH